MPKALVATVWLTEYAESKGVLAYIGYLAFEDESGISEKPVVRTTWALKGKTPTIQSSGS